VAAEAKLPAAQDFHPSHGTSAFTVVVIASKNVSLDFFVSSDRVLKIIPHFRQLNLRVVDGCSRVFPGDEGVDHPQQILQSIPFWPVGGLLKPKGVVISLQVALQGLKLDFIESVGFDPIYEWYDFVGIDSHNDGFYDELHSGSVPVPEIFQRQHVVRCPFMGPRKPAQTVVNLRGHGIDGSMIFVQSCCSKRFHLFWLEHGSVGDDSDRQPDPGCVTDEFNGVRPQEGFSAGHPDVFRPEPAAKSLQHAHPIPGGELSLVRSIVLPDFTHGAAAVTALHQFEPHFRWLRNAETGPVIQFLKQSVKIKPRFCKD
jgi:hypothetical protein